ncbi:MAG: type II secretion system GspH family protein [Candidatus Gastranaerophilales bacterium]|nr:type II secretion system GspH family protein [Candidatus Gastranaerophilales bacterium]
MKFCGFTLAEVLITLGIIGVVAAMTIPTLIANTNSLKYRSQFKKSISTLSQAGKMARAQYDFSYGDSEPCIDPTKDHPENHMSFCSILNGTISGLTYLNMIDISEGSNTKWNTTNYTIKDSSNIRLSSMYIYQLADGTILGFGDDTISDCTLSPGESLTNKLNEKWEKGYFCAGFIDVNGISLPNKEVTCSDGKDTKLDPEHPCIVKNDANHMTDIYPVVFHDDIVEPATNASAYVLKTAK